MTFQDHFSRQAEQYARHRPRYPQSLYDYLAALAPARGLAWDCGTGNGQVALGLAEIFMAVIATDPSAEQIARAFPHPRIAYRVEQVEATSIQTHSVDLITAGTAIHWFDFDRYYAEVRRVGKPGAILAAWTYSFPVIQPEIDAWIERFYHNALGEYWPERIRYLEEQYKSLPFPFDEIMPPEFTMEARWDLDCLVGFLASWSATRRFTEEAGPLALEEHFKDLAGLWGEAALQRKIRWPLFFRIGRLPEDSPSA
jgi:SAM-dependent methyltransferase